MPGTKFPILLSALLLLALAAMGVGYGLWAKILTLEGTVHTGVIDTEWTSCICQDQGLDPNPFPNPPKDKDVGSTVCWIDPENSSILHLVVQNGYPSYWNNCEIHYANTGTIPTIIRGYKVVPKNFTPSTAYGADNGQLWVKYWDGVGTQMEPCPHETCEQSGSIQFHVEQPAEQLHTYEFDVLICMGQWNEDATLDQCLSVSQ